MIRKQSAKQCSNTKKEYKYNPIVVKQNKKTTVYTYYTIKGGSISLRIPFPVSRKSKKMRNIFLKTIGNYEKKKKR